MARTSDEHRTVEQHSPDLVGVAWVLRVAAALKPSAASTVAPPTGVEGAPGRAAEALGVLAAVIMEDAWPTPWGQPATAPATPAEAVALLRLDTEQWRSPRWADLIEHASLVLLHGPTRRPERVAARLGIEFPDPDGVLLTDRTRRFFFSCTTCEHIYARTAHERFIRDGGRGCPACSSARTRATTARLEREAAPAARSSTGRDSVRAVEAVTELPRGSGAYRGLLGKVMLPPGIVGAEVLDARADGDLVAWWSEDALEMPQRKRAVQREVQRIYARARVAWKVPAGPGSERLYLVGHCGYEDHQGWVLRPHEAMRAAQQHGHPCPECARDGRALIAVEAVEAHLGGDAQAGQWLTDAEATTPQRQAIDAAVLTATGPAPRAATEADSALA